MFADPPLRALVVDDSAVIRELIAVNLELEGFEVVTAETGKSGVALARKTKPNAVILDLMLPDENGFVVCELYNYRPAVALEVEKTATPTSVPPGGGEVTYTISVRNPSVVDRVRLDGLDDDRFGDLLDPGDAITSTTCPELAAKVVEPGRSLGEASLR